MMASCHLDALARSKCLFENEGNSHLFKVAKNLKNPFFIFLRLNKYNYFRLRKKKTALGRSFLLIGLCIIDLKYYYDQGYHK